jgi:hypothetical protein
MNKKAKKQVGEATRASVMKEMKQPRMAKSVREEEVNQVAERMATSKAGKAKLPLHPLPLPRHTG